MQRNHLLARSPNRGGTRERRTRVLDVAVPWTQGHPVRHRVCEFGSPLTDVNRTRAERIEAGGQPLRLPRTRPALLQTLQHGDEQAGLRHGPLKTGQLRWG